MTAASIQAGLSEAETQATIESGLRAGVTAPLLQRGSQVEVAQLLRSDLEQRCGEIVNADGQCWHYVGDRWVAIDDDDLRRFVYQYDGLPIHPRGVLKLTRPQIGSRSSAPSMFSGAVAKPLTAAQKARCSVTVSVGFTASKWPT